MPDTPHEKGGAAQTAKPGRCGGSKSEYVHREPADGRLGLRLLAEGNAAMFGSPNATMLASPKGLTGEQISAARSLIGMNQSDLAERSGVSLPTIKRLEGMGCRVTGGRPQTLNAIKDTLEAAGVEFMVSLRSESIPVFDGEIVRLRSRP